MDTAERAALRAANETALEEIGLGWLNVVGASTETAEFLDEGKDAKGHGSNARGAIPWNDPHISQWGDSRVGKEEPTAENYKGLESHLRTDHDLAAYKRSSGWTTPKGTEKPLRRHMENLHRYHKGMHSWHDESADEGADGEVIMNESATETTINESVIMPLVEKGIGKDGTMMLKIIAPGWGSSGYYSKEVLKRDGPKVFAEGTKNYIDHPTTSEDKGRPERSIRDLASVQIEPARYDENGPAGPGLYARSKVFSGARALLEELHPYIGTSIRAMGKASMGEAEGRKGNVIETLLAARSVDYVTQAGAGGKVIPILESFREGTVETPVEEAGSKHFDSTGDELRQHLATVHYKDNELLADAKDKTMHKAHMKCHGVEESAEENVDDKERKELTEARDAAVARADRAELALLIREAGDVALTEVANIALPDIAKERIVKAATANPKRGEDGALDATALREAVKEQAKAEVDYLARATGSGRIRGMGGDANSAATDVKESAKRVDAALAVLTGKA